MERPEGPIGIAVQAIDGIVRYTIDRGGMPVIDCMLTPENARDLANDFQWCAIAAESQMPAIK